jgi:hypothetical protein
LTHGFPLLGPQAALIGGLGGERTRWQEMATALAKAQVRARGRPLMFRWSLKATRKTAAGLCKPCMGRVSYFLVEPLAVHCRRQAHSSLHVKFACRADPNLVLVPGQECLLGDMLVAAATIAYLGAFTAPWRTRLVQGALALCTAQVLDRLLLRRALPSHPLAGASEYQGHY